MGKSYKGNAKYDKWRKQGDNKKNKKHGGNNHNNAPKHYSPFEDPIDFHQSIAGGQGNND